MIETLEYDELMKIKKDIASGSVHIKQLITDKIKEIEKLHDVRCSVCNSEINPFSTHNYTLVFGPQDFRKKATFCALDCMGYFIEELKTVKTVKQNV